jgi:hypothetical protein
VHPQQTAAGVEQGAIAGREEIMVDLILVFLWVGIVEVLLIGTGYCVLYLLTFGRIRKFHSPNRANRDYLVGLIVGAIFWIGIAFLARALGHT